MREHCEHWRNRRQVPCPPECDVQRIPAETTAGQWLELHAQVGELVDRAVADHRLVAALVSIWLLVLLCSVAVLMLPWGTA